MTAPAIQWRRQASQLTPQALGGLDDQEAAAEFRLFMEDIETLLDALAGDVATAGDTIWVLGSAEAAHPGDTVQLTTDYGGFFIGMADAVGGVILDVALGGTADHDTFGVPLANLELYTYGDGTNADAFLSVTQDLFLEGGRDTFIQGQGGTLNDIFLGDNAGRDVFIDAGRDLYITQHGSGTPIGISIESVHGDIDVLADDGGILIEADGGGDVDLFTQSSLGGSITVISDYVHLASSGTHLDLGATSGDIDVGAVDALWTLSGTFAIDANNDISLDAADDIVIVAADQLSMNSAAMFITNTSATWQATGVGTNTIAISADDNLNWTAGNRITLGASAADIQLTAATDVSLFPTDDLTVVAGDAINASAGGDIVLTATGNVIVTAGSFLELPGLPTATPGGTDRVWNNGGVLNIT